MSAAITDGAADLDKDGQVSLLEAFIAASHGVEEFYKKEGRLATEHALLDDNGDGHGIPADWFQGTRATRAAKDGAPLDGARAHQWHLIRSAADQAMPADLRARRDDLELKIESLRAKKATLPEDDYYKQLDDLLLRLARVYERHAPTTRR
jgi:predicted ATPase